MLVSKPSLFPRLILTVAIVMFAVAAVSAIGACAARETTAPGSVVDFAIRAAANGALYYRPVVAFALPDGSRRTLTLAEESADPAYSVDQSVSIAYDPAQPASARIKSTASTVSRWILPLVTGILGAAFAIATLFARSVLRPGPELARCR